MSELKTIIDANIKENGNQEITGKVLNYVLNKIAEGTQKDWNESDATNEEYIKGRTHGVTYEHVSVEGTLKELGYIPGEYVSVLHFARVHGGLEGRGLYLGGLLYNPIVGEEYIAKYDGPSVYARVVEVEDGYDVQIKGASDTGNLLKVAIVEYKRIDDAYISKDIARKSQVDALEDKVDNLPQGEEFDKQGNYPLVHVGTADDLAGRGESVPAEFGFRASGGKSIKDGRAYIKRIKGNSVVWNQKNDKSTRPANGDNTQGSAPMYDTIGNETHYKECIGHKIYARAISSDANIDRIYYTDNVQMNLLDGALFTASASATNIGIVARIPVGVRVDNASINVIFHDLTQMFQAGNEPTTIEEFNARVATLGVDLYAYNEGQVIHCNTESIKSVGDNAWDEQWESGTFSIVTGENINNSYVDSQIRTKNLIRVLPNETYYLTISQASIWAVFYDAEGNLIEKPVGDIVVDNAINIKGAMQFSTPTNAAYMKFYTVAEYGTTYNNDIMITLVHSGWKQDTDAGYQPYWQDTLPLPIIRKYFPDGMKSAGNAHDEIRYNKASGKWEYSKGRFKSVDLGSFGWYKDSTRDFFKVDIDEVINTNYLCAKYMPITYQQLGVDIGISCVDLGGGKSQVRISDTSYTDAAAFKAMLQEKQVKLYYESNDWEWVELDTEDQNFRDYYQVADFGTEQSQSNVPSAAFSADIIYQFNAVDMIREHELEITELQKVIATMQAQLASLTNS